MQNFNTKSRSKTETLSRIIDRRSPDIYNRFYLIAYKLEQLLSRV